MKKIILVGFLNRENVKNAPHSLYVLPFNNEAYFSLFLCFSRSAKAIYPSMTGAFFVSKYRLLEFFCIFENKFIIL